MAADTTAGYAAAEMALRGALVQEPRNTEALGLWLEAVARGRGPSLARSELSHLIDLGMSALDRMSRRPPLLLGVAALLRVRGKDTDVVLARRFAQQAVDVSQPSRPDGGTVGASSGPAWAGSARMALAETYATSSGALALSLLRDAEQLDPSLRHVWNVRAVANASAGAPRAALADLQARLKLDPDHPATLRAQADLWAQVGEVAQARKIYDRLQAERRTQDGPAAVDMAELRAGAERTPAEAVRLLSAVIAKGKLTGGELVDAQCARPAARAATTSRCGRGRAAVRLSPTTWLAGARST
jgi:tetratricopeptide (TPR) repeat protein